MKEFMLTTKDNPYNPFDSFAAWYSFDTRHGYHTSSYLARIVKTSNEVSEADFNSAMEDAIDEIIREDLFGRYLKVERETDDSEDLLESMDG